MAVSSVDAASARAQELPKPEPHVLVLFGATGDLARRKLIPGLFHLEQVGLMPDDYRIVGTSLDELDEEAFRHHVRDALREFCRMEVDRDNWKTFSERLDYVPSLSFYGKRPGRGMHLEKASMQFSLGETPQHKDALEAYERLIYDAMIGDRTLFTTAEGVERLWEISAPLLERPSPLRPYAQGSWGPSEIDALIAPRHWRLPFERKGRGAG